MRWRRLAASVWATETTLDEADQADQHAPAPSSCSHSSGSKDGSGEGRQAARVSRRRSSTPLPSRPNARRQATEAATAATGPALASEVGGARAHPGRRRSGFRPLRTQNRKRGRGDADDQRRHVDLAPASSASPRRMCGQRLALGLDAEDVLHLARGDQDARGGDEARDDRVRQEVGEKPSRSTPMASSMRPERKASTMRGGRYSGRARRSRACRPPPRSSARPRPPARPRACGWCRRSHRRSAAGSTRRARLPAAARPASRRRATCGISMIVTITAATRSLASVAASSRSGTQSRIGR